MYLSQLQVENYRAVRSAALDFDESTILIGENDCGKTSLLDALSKVLGGNSDDETLRFHRYEFHHHEGTKPPAGPIRIVLVFKERQPGEWTDKAYAPIAGMLPAVDKQPRELQLDLTAAPTEGDEAEAEWTLAARGGGRSVSDLELLHWLRQMNPLIRLSGGMLTGHGIDHPPASEPGKGRIPMSPEMEEGIQRIMSATASLLSGNSTDMAADLERGFAAARVLIEGSDNHLAWGRLSFGRVIGEILGREGDGPYLNRSIVLNESGSYSERLGVLLLIAALLRASPEGLVGEAQPIWILEDPEAHLHPMTLTSVVLFLGHIQWQKIITTHSGDFLASLPLRWVRRLTRYEGVVRQYRVRERALSLEDLRRLGYHQRAHNGVASFARLWLLVEGESEFWVVPQIARLMGYEFALEGISCIEFAQCGLEPLVKAARELGIEWHLLADGDDAGRHYIESARDFLDGDEEQERLTLLRELDIEHCFWHSGYAGVYEHHSRLAPAALQQQPPKQVIRQAVKNRSKPYLALSVVEAVSETESPGIPVVLKGLVETCVRLAREAPARHAMNSQETGPVKKQKPLTDKRDHP